DHALPVGHLLAVPEGILVGAVFAGLAVAGGRDELHAGVVQAVTAVLVEVEVVGVAGVVVGEVDIGDAAGGVALGPERAVARQPGGAIVVVVVDEAIQGGVDLVEM